MNEKAPKTHLSTEATLQKGEDLAVLSAVAGVASQSVDLEELLGRILDEILSFDSLSLQKRGAIFLA